MNNRITIIPKLYDFKWFILIGVYCFFICSIVFADTTNIQSNTDSHYALLQQAEQQRQAMLEQYQQPEQANQYQHASSQQHVVGSDTNAAITSSNHTHSTEVSLTPQQQLKAAQREATFESILEKTLPMTPSQIERLRRMYDKTQAAAAKAPKIPPLPTSTSQAVDLSPGAVPPVIRLSQGFVSSLVFVDSTGAPWPITAYDLGNPKAFNIQWDQHNTLMVQAMSPYTYGNLAVKLKDQTTPVMLTLIPGQRIVDYRVDLRVSGLGPNAQITTEQLGQRLPLGADPILLQVLDGVPPAGSKALKVTGGDAQAWELSGKLYVRTHYNVLSPAWLGKMSSADGTHAFEMPSVPVLLVERNGKTTQLHVGRYVSGQ